MSVLTSIALGVVGIAVPGAGIAIAIARYGAKAVMEWAKDAASWLFLHPMAALAIAAGIVIFIQGHKLGNRDETIAAQAVKIKQVQSAYDKTVADYRAAAAKATADDAANKARVEAAQQQATKEVSHEYEDRLAALRRQYDAERLRPGTPATNPGRPGAAPVSVLPHTPGGPDAAPASGADAAFNCSANAIQLDELQKWVREQAGIPVGN